MKTEFGPVEVCFSDKPLTEVAINAHRRRAYAVFWLIVLAIGVGIFNIPGDFSKPVVLVVRVVLLLLGCAFVAKLFDDVPGVCARMDTWLPAGRCEELALMCERNPGLIAYRDQVREMGRLFTYGEFKAMKVWVAQQRTQAAMAQEDARLRAACYRLYGIAHGGREEGQASAKLKR